MLTLALLGAALATEPAPAPPAVDEAPTSSLTPTSEAVAEPAALLPATLSAPDPDEPAAERPPASTRLVFVPGVGWNAGPDRSVNGFSTGILAHGKDLEGVDAQWVGSWFTGTASGLQTAMAYTVAHDVKGLQATLGVAWARGNVDVGQTSLGLNVAEGYLKGLQATTGVNIAGDGVEGIQASVGLNLAGGHTEGVQASSGLNIADTMEGVQAGMVNVVDEMQGLQLGIVNVGKEVKGVQLGLVNIAETSDVSIAPLNLVKDGLHRVDVWASESAMTTVAAKIGSKHVYTLAGAGWVRPDQNYWTFGGGFGVHLQKRQLWTEIDGTVWGVADGMRLAPGLHNKLRGSVGLEVAPAFQPFVGVSMNGWYGSGQIWPRAVDIPSQTTRDNRYVAWPGAHVGISF